MAGKYTAHHPAPPNRPGVNWVEKAGGLPGPIDAIMRALMAKGWPQSRAVATAVNHVKKGCATGRAFGGKAKLSAEARAKCCAAVARWEAMKAAAKADTSIPADERRRLELAFKRIEGDALRIDMAKDPPEDSPAFNWRKHGNRRRGVVLKNGKKAVVSPAQFDKVKKAGQISPKTPKLKGDDPKGASKDDRSEDEKHPRAEGGQPTGGQFIKADSADSAEKKGAAEAMGCKGGKLSEECVRKFQKKKGLTVDGKVGSQTAGAIKGKKQKAGALSKDDKKALAGKTDAARTGRVMVDLAPRKGGLVATKIKVTNKKTGKTHERKAMLRPEQVKQMKQKAGAGKTPTVSVGGLKVSQAQAAVLAELGKVPKAKRPPGWKELVQAIADPRHGGRLGPEGRRLMHSVAKAAGPGSPIGAAAGNALRSDAKPKVKRDAVGREVKAAGKKPFLLKLDDGSAQIREGSREGKVLKAIPNLAAYEAKLKKAKAKKRKQKAA